MRPNAKVPGPIDQEPHSVTELFEHRIAWAEHYGAHHQEPGVSGGPHESLIAVVSGVAIAAGEHTLTTGLVQNFAEERSGYSIIGGDALFEASAQSPEPGGAVAATNTFWLCPVPISSSNTKVAMGDGDLTMPGPVRNSITLQSTSTGGRRELVRWLSSSLSWASTFNPPSTNRLKRMMPTLWPWLRRTAPIACPSPSPTRSQSRIISRL